MLGVASHGYGLSLIDWVQSVVWAPSHQRRPQLGEEHAGEHQAAAGQSPPGEDLAQEEPAAEGGKG